MDKELKKIEIIAQHGRVKGMKKTIKKLNRLMDDKVSMLEKRVESDEKEERFYGGFEDCGSFYSSQLERSRGALSEAKDKNLLFFHIVEDLIYQSKLLKHLKRKFAEEYGQEELDKIVSQLKLLGEKKAKEESLMLKEKKHQIKMTMHVAQVLIGERMDDLLRSIQHKGISDKKEDIYRLVNSMMHSLRLMRKEVVKSQFSEISFKDMEKYTAGNLKLIKDKGHSFLRLFSDQFVEQLEMEDGELKKLKNFILVIKKSLV